MVEMTVDICHLCFCSLPLFFVGFVDLSKACFRRFIAVIHVRVMFAGQLAVRLLQNQPPADVVAGGLVSGGGQGDTGDAGETLAKQTSILLKPNLINSSPHPVTTPAAGAGTPEQKPFRVMVRKGSRQKTLKLEAEDEAAAVAAELLKLLGNAQPLQLRRDIILRIQ